MSLAIPRLSGGVPLLGHLLQLRRDPVGLMQRCRDECGEVGELRLAGQSLVMLYGEDAQEAFFRAPEEQLDQAAAYPFMKPVFVVRRWRNSAQYSRSASFVMRSA